jgi:hypothetical protein
MQIPAWLTEPPNDKLRRGRYFFLVVDALLLAFAVGWRGDPSMGRLPHKDLLLLTFAVLLVSHISHSFEWSRRTTIVLRLSTVGLALFSCVYMILA